MTYDPRGKIGQVRLLLNDVAEDRGGRVFSDQDIRAFLAMEGGHVKLAAAQAIDTNADNEVLASKVLRTQDLNTDGAKVADALHKRATMLREQHYQRVVDDADTADGSCLTVEQGPVGPPELAEYAAVSPNGYYGFC